MIIILLGKPCSGKGTISKNIKNIYAFKHISTGDILREHGLLSSDGKLVSDELVCSLIGEDILKNNNIILDGFPRTMVQYNFLLDFLSKNNLKVDKYIYIDISDDVVYQRMIKRKSEENRLDDNDISLKTRLSEFNINTRPMIDSIVENGDILIIDENSSITDYKEILETEFKI